MPLDFACSLCSNVTYGNEPGKRPTLCESCEASYPDGPTWKTHFGWYIRRWREAGSIEPLYEIH